MKRRDFLEASLVGPLLASLPMPLVLSVEGLHDRRTGRAFLGVGQTPDTDPRNLGWKALAVNLSDLAAMGATPRWALLAGSLPAPKRRKR